MQQCSKCKKWLEESEFYKNSNKKGSKNGLSRWCKECSKQCYQEHKEKIYSMQNNIGIQINIKRN